MERESTIQTASTWRRYKQGQEQFTDWLKRTADKFTVQPQEPSTVNSKGGGPAKGPSKPLPPGAATKVHYKELEPLAEVVAANVKPEDIPAAPLAILRDVLALRKKSGRFFRQKIESNSGDKKLDAANNQHEHMIKVLEKVLGVLERARDTIRGKWEEPKRRRPFDTETLGYMFELLKIDEPIAEAPTASNAGADQPDNATTVGQNGEASKAISSDSSSESDVTVPAKTVRKTKKGRKAIRRSRGGGKKQRQHQNLQLSQTGKKKKESVPNWVENFHFTSPDDDDDDDEFDYYMCAYCFFADFNAIRDYLAELWCDYFYDKTVSLNVLAIITNAAFELFHEMERELWAILAQEKMTQLADYVNMMETLFFDYGIDHISYDEDDDLSQEELDEKIWHSEANWLAFGAYSVINDFLRNIPPGKVPMFPPSKTEDLKYGARTNSEFHDFHHGAARQLLSQVVITKAMKVNGQLPSPFPAQTDLLSDFEDVLHVRFYPSAFVFEFQIYLDVRNILETQVSDAHDELQATAAACVATMESHFDLEKSGNTPLGRAIQNNLDEIREYVIEDFTLQDKIRRFREKGVMDEIESHQLHKLDPIWAGLMDFRIKLRANMAAFQLLATEPSSDVIGMAAVYLIARRHEDGEKIFSWPEMDRFIEFHGEERILGGRATEINSMQDMLSKLAESLATNQALQARWIALFKSLDAAVALLGRYSADNENSQYHLRYLSRLVQAHLDRKRFSPSDTPDPVEKAAEAYMSADDDISLDNGTDMLVRTTSNEQALKAADGSHRFAPSLQHVDILDIIDEEATRVVGEQLEINYLKLRDEAIASTTSLRLLVPEMRDFASWKDMVNTLSGLGEERLVQAVIGAVESVLSRDVPVIPAGELPARTPQVYDSVRAFW